MDLLLKVGGSLMERPDDLRDLAFCLSELQKQGRSMILVHGGGKDITRNLEWLHEKAEFVEGLRVTSPSAMDMVEMTLSGKVNKDLVRMIQAHGGRAAGISGVDGDSFRCVPLGERWGRVGSVDHVKPDLCLALVAGGFLPVVSPVSVDSRQLAHNVNADEAARALAESLTVKRLVFLSDVEGVRDSEGRCIPRLNKADALNLMEVGVISGGMIPKIRSCLSALQNGVSQVHICGWRDKASFMRQVEGELNEGTVLVAG